MSKNYLVIALLLHRAKVKANIQNAELKTALDIILQHKESARMKNEMFRLPSNYLRQMRLDNGIKDKGLVKRMKHNDRLRWFCIMSMPFFLFWFSALIFESDQSYYMKSGLFVLLYMYATWLSNFFFDEDLFMQLPVSIYFCLKFWLYFTWLAYIAPVAGMSLTAFLVLLSLAVWYFFIQCWKGDPGVIKGNL